MTRIQRGRKSPYTTTFFPSFLTRPLPLQPNKNPQIHSPQHHLQTLIRSPQNKIHRCGLLRAWRHAAPPAHATLAGPSFQASAVVQPGSLTAASSLFPSSLLGSSVKSLLLSWNQFPVTIPSFKP